jgi:hypothetical protein
MINVNLSKLPVNLSWIIERKLCVHEKNEIDNKILEKINYRENWSTPIQLFSHTTSFSRLIASCVFLLNKRIVFVMAIHLRARRLISYKQGQYVDQVRQYFYYIDHEGQLFMHDSRMRNFTSCFKGNFSFIFSSIFKSLCELLHIFHV